MRETSRAVLGAAFGLLAITLAMPPARADWDQGGRGEREGGHDWREHDWREHDWREHDWREHEWRRWHQAQEPYRYAFPPPVVYAPRPRYYAPAPRYYAAPPAYYAPSPGYYGD